MRARCGVGVVLEGQERKGRHEGRAGGSNVTFPDGSAPSRLTPLAFQNYTHTAP
jgi:prepilin-type processing-associated H-X9-DG protein